MKICLLTSTYPRFPDDGAGRFIHSIAAALVRLGHEVHVIAPYHPAAISRLESVRVHYFRYIVYDRWAIMGYGQAMYNDQVLYKTAYLLAPLFFLSAFRKLVMLHIRYKFDILHAHWVIPNAPMAALLSYVSKIPLIITLHGSDIFLARKHAILGAIARICFRQASAITACSPQLYEGALALGANPERVHLVLWGADPQFFDPQAFSSRAELRAQLGLPSNVPILLTLGRLVKKKGIEYLVQALQLLRKHVPDVMVLVGGDGPERPRLEQLAIRLGVRESLRFLGTVSWRDVPRYLHASDVFVVPSVEDESGNLDGLPTTILEAMAAAKPVVASAVGGIPLVIENDRTGVLVPQRDPQALADALRKLLLDETLRTRLGAEARKRVQVELNWDQVAHIFTGLYLKSLQK